MLDSIPNLLQTNRAPNGDEKAWLTQFLTENGAKLDVINNRITEVEAQLQTLKNERNILLKTLAPYQRALSPIRELPEDIVRAIFIKCREMAGQYPSMANTESPVLLTQICSPMRRIALTTPALWDGIHIAILARIPSEMHPEARSIMTARIAGVREWLLGRSGSLPLHISLYCGYGDIPSDSFESIMDIILACCSRWKTIYFYCPPRKIVAHVGPLIPANVPHLQSVSLCSSTGTEVEFNGNSVWSGVQIFAAKNLTHFNVEGLGQKYYHDIPINWANLTHVSLFDGEHGNPSSVSVAHILRNSPRLTNCYIMLNTNQSVDTDTTEIRLPFLQGLIIEGAVGNRADASPILNLIDAPALTAVVYSPHGMEISEVPTALITLLKKSPGITKFSIGKLLSAKILEECLQHLPFLASLRVRKLSSVFRRNTDSEIHDKLLGRLVTDDISTGLCPKLQYFYCDDEIMSVSHNILHSWIARKGGSDRKPHLSNWEFICMNVGYKPGLQEDSAEEIALAQENGVKLHIFFQGPMRFYSRVDDGITFSRSLTSKEEWPVTDPLPTDAYMY